MIQEAYLGVDFWRAFELAPEVFQGEEINIEYLPIDSTTENHLIEQHNLTEKEKQQLQEVKSKFKTFEKNGLGNNMYEVETLNGLPLGVYHAKDIKQ